MKVLPLQVQSRDTRGRSPARRLRRSARIPAVIYGESGLRQLSLDNAEFKRLWLKAAGRTVLIELQAEAGQSPALSFIQEVQRDPRTDRFLHIDFREVRSDKEMHVTIPVHTTGEAFGVKNEGGLVEILSHQIRIRCLPQDLPEQIVVDVTELKVGQSVHVRELKPLPGVTFADQPHKVVVACVGKAAEEEKPAEEAVTPAEGEAAAGEAKPGAAPAAGDAKAAAGKPGAAPAGKAGAAPAAKAAAGAKAPAGKPAKG